MEGGNNELQLPRYHNKRIIHGAQDLSIVALSLWASVLFSQASPSLNTWLVKILPFPPVIMLFRKFHLLPLNNFLYPDALSGNVANSFTTNTDGAAINDSPVQSKSMNHLNLINALMLQTLICIYMSFYLKQCL